jgi:hypothetical protein
MQPQNNYGFGMPTTAIRFRPVNNNTKTKNVLLAVSKYLTIFKKRKQVVTQFLLYRFKWLG